MKTVEAPRQNIVFWHRELPPLNALPMGEYSIEATSRRVRNSLDRRDELWNRYYDDLMDQARVRIEQEVARLGGDFAHILDESVDARRDDRTGEAWLHGSFTYMLYGRRKEPSVSHG